MPIMALPVPFSPHICRFISLIDDVPDASADDIGFSSEEVAGPSPTRTER
jgi:hypothetical protein